MHQIFVVLLYLNFIFSFCESRHRKVICDDAKDITMNENEIIFIETPCFPAAVTDEMVHNCKLNIFGDSTVESESMYLTIVLATGVAREIFKVIDADADTTYWLDLGEGIPDYYRTNSSSVIFAYDNYLDGDYNAFQGYIYYEKADDKPNCDMTNPTPKEYGFKFTSLLSHDDVSNLQDITDALVIVKNSSDYIITDIFTKPNIPYYNVDHNITVTLQTTSPKPVFNAFISLVLKNPNRTSANCQIDSQDGIITWHSDLYRNNAACNYSTTIKSRQQLFLGLTRTIDIFEAFADILTFQNDNDKDSITHVDSVDEENDVIYSVYGPYKNGTTKTINWRFLSDGSIVTQNFAFEFVPYDCVCNNNTIIVPCNDEHIYSIIDTTHIINSRYKYWYCANMNCTFTINVAENCQDKYIVAEVFLDIESHAKYQLISNDKLLAKSCNTTENCSVDHLGIINPHSKTILQFSSGPILETTSFELHLQAYENFKISPPVIITHSVPWQSLNSRFSDIRSIFTVELSDELKGMNDSILINYHMQLYHVYTKYFEDLNLTNALTTDDINSMNLKSFVVFVNNQPGGLDHYIVKAKKASTEGCRFPDTVFPLVKPNKNDDTAYTLRHSMLSTENESCQILITRSVHIMVIKQLFSYQNETRKNIEIFNGINNQEKILDFNEDNAFFKLSKTK